MVHCFIRKKLIRSSLRRVHFLELIDGSLQSVLHHVAQIKVGLSNLIVWHHKNSLDILQSKSVSLDTFEGLGPSDKGLDVFRVDLKNSRTIGNDSIKVGDLLVARCNINIIEYICFAAPNTTRKIYWVRKLLEQKNDDKQNSTSKIGASMIPAC